MVRSIGCVYDMQACGLFGLKQVRDLTLNQVSGTRHLIDAGTPELFQALTCVGLHMWSFPFPGSSLVPSCINSTPAGLNFNACRT